MDATQVALSEFGRLGRCHIPKVSQEPSAARIGWPVPDPTYMNVTTAPASTEGTGEIKTGRNGDGLDSAPKAREVRSAAAAKLSKIRCLVVCIVLG